MAAIALGFVVQGLYILLWLVLARAMHLPIAPLTLFFAVPVVTAFRDASRHSQRPRRS